MQTFVQPVYFFLILFRCTANYAKGYLACWWWLRADWTAEGQAGCYLNSTKVSEIPMYPLHSSLRQKRATIMSLISRNGWEIPNGYEKIQLLTRSEARSVSKATGLGLIVVPYKIPTMFLKDPIKEKTRMWNRHMWCSVRNHFTVYGVMELAVNALSFRKDWIRYPEDCAQSIGTHYTVFAASPGRTWLLAALSATFDAFETGRVLLLKQTDRMKVNLFPDKVAI